MPGSQQMFRSVRETSCGQSVRPSLLCRVEIKTTVFLVKLLQGGRGRANAIGHPFIPATRQAHQAPQATKTGQHCGDLAFCFWPASSHGGTETDLRVFLSFSACQEAGTDGQGCAGSSSSSRHGSWLFLFCLISGRFTFRGPPSSRGSGCGVELDKGEKKEEKPRPCHS